MTFKHNLAPIGAARKWFEEDNVGPIASWMSPEDVKTREKIFAAEAGGYGPPLNWYKCHMANLNSEDDASIPADRLKIEQPTLLITCGNDPVGIPVLAVEGTKPFVQMLEIKQVDTGHWLQLEKPDEVNHILKDFLEQLKVS